MSASEVSYGVSGGETPVCPAGGAAAKPPAPAGGLPPVPSAGQGVPVTPLPLISGPREWRHLLSGIDTLDLGFYVTWGDDWLKLMTSLDETKASAERTEGVMWRYEKLPPLRLLPRGKPPMYAFHIHHPAAHVFVSRSRCSHQYPTVYVSFLAEKLWQIGPANCVDMIAHLIERMGGRIDGAKVSRVDLAVDFEVTSGLALDFLRTHKVSRSDECTHHMKGERLETFYCGNPSGDIRLRLYNKAAEIVEHDKLWFCDLWKIENPKDVWRVEFQLRRNAMKQFRVESVESLKEKSGGLWKFLTDSWFSLRLQDNQNASRRTVHLWWQAVQEIARDFGPSVFIERRREPDKVADASWYVSHAAGCLVGYAARMGVPDLVAAADAFRSEMETHWELKDFSERYQLKRLQLNFDDEERGAA